MSCFVIISFVLCALQAQKTRADEVDTQRREVESQLRGDLATAEARLRRLEQESQRATSAVEDGKASTTSNAITTCLFFVQVMGCESKAQCFC